MTMFFLVCLVLLIGTYPASPVLFLFLIFNNHIAFAGACLMAIAIAFYVAHRGVRASTGLNTRRLRYLVIFLALILIVKVVAHQPPLAIREFMVVSVALCLLMLGLGRIRNLMRGITYLTAILLTISLGSVVLVGLGVASLQDWNVSALPELSRANPIVARHEFDRETDWYMPLYLSVLPLELKVTEIAFGLAYQRQPLLFTEWTYSWYFLWPLLMYAVADRSLRLRALVLLVLGAALVLGLSAWGVIVGALTVLLMLLARSLRSPLKVGLVVLVVAGLAASQMSIETALQLVGGNKLEQFKLYSDIIDFSGTFSPIGPPGNPYEGAGGEEKHAYGSTHILFAYGAFGALAYLAIFFFGASVALRVLAQWRKYDHLVRYMAIAVVSSLLLGLKVPYLVSLWQLLFLAFLVRLCDAREEHYGMPVHGS